MTKDHALDLSWLIKLRWGASVVQGALLAVAWRMVGAQLPLKAMGALMAVGAASNVAAALWARRATRVPEWTLASLMGLDVLLLTGLLSLSGGALNPFTILYLVNIALAAVVLRPRWTWALLALSIACFGGLFLKAPVSHAEHMAQMELHLQGMWAAFALAASLIVYFVHRVARALAQRERQLVQAQRLASLTTLAAGAAHELATPLSTIAVVAKEQEHRLLREGAELESLEDVRLIRQQVERCRGILTGMAADAGSEAVARVQVSALVELALREVDVARVELAPGAGAEVSVPLTATAHALRSVVRNALQASAAPVRVAVARGARTVSVSVTDRGAGMPPEVLAQAGEPFYTTKAPGEGMGLGLFLTRAVLERSGGRLELDSALGRGTTATLVLPAA